MSPWNHRVHEPCLHFWGPPVKIPAQPRPGRSHELLGPARRRRDRAARAARGGAGGAAETVGRGEAVARGAGLVGRGGEVR